MSCAEAIERGAREQAHKEVVENHILRTKNEEQATQLKELKQDHDARLLAEHRLRLIEPELAQVKKRLEEYTKTNLKGPTWENDVETALRTTFGSLFEIEKMTHATGQGDFHVTWHDPAMGAPLLFLIECKNYVMLLPREVKKFHEDIERVRPDGALLVNMGAFPPEMARTHGREAREQHNVWMVSNCTAAQVVQYALDLMVDVKANRLAEQREPEMREKFAQIRSLSVQNATHTMFNLVGTLYERSRDAMIAVNTVATRWKGDHLNDVKKMEAEAPLLVQQSAGLIPETANNVAQPRKRITPEYGALIEQSQAAPSKKAKT